MIPIKLEILSVVECDEWADSTDSRKLNVDGEYEGIVRGLGSAPESFICGC